MFHFDVNVLVLFVLMSVTIVAVYKAFTGWGHPSAPSQTN